MSDIEALRKRLHDCTLAASMAEHLRGKAEEAYEKAETAWLVAEIERRNALSDVQQWSSQSVARTAHIAVPRDVALKIFDLLTYMSDHGGGEQRLPDCRKKGRCASCDAYDLGHWLSAEMEKP